MKINEIVIKVKQSSLFNEYNTVDVSVETEHGIIEKHELIERDDFKSRFSSLIEIVKQEIEFFLKENE